MDLHSAEQHLRVIRTLMERAALYRRALGPLFIVAGLIGVGAGILGGAFLPVDPLGFLFYWSAVAAVAAVASLILVRKQARQANEPVWSPPTLRVARALLPAFAAGAAFGGIWALSNHFGINSDMFHSSLLAYSWAVFYGCGICAAGEHVTSSLRLAGWIFVAAGLAGFSTMIELPDLIIRPTTPVLLRDLHHWAAQVHYAAWSNPHAMMGVMFGGLHLACGLVLWQRERRRPTP